MNKSLAMLVVLAVFVFLAGGTVASAQSPDGASHERLQQRAPAACPPDIEWGCVLSGSTSPGLALNSTSTANNSNSLYASLNNPGSGSAAVWGRVLGTGSTGYGLYGSHQGGGYGVYGFSNNGIGFLGYSNTSTGMQGETNGTGAQAGVLGLHRATTGAGAGVEGRTNSTNVEATGVLGIVSSTSAGDDSAGVHGINRGAGYGVWGEGWIGVLGGTTNGYGLFGVSSLGPAGVYGEARATTGRGVYGEATGSSGSGVYGRANGLNAAGVYGTNATGAGVIGNSTSSTGVHGSSTSGSGVTGAANANGVAGVYGTNGSGAGVWGHTPSNSYGVYGHSTGASGRGVYGKTSGGSAFGVFGENSAGGVGVAGTSSSGTGVSGTSTSNTGVYGSSGSGWGVEGRSDSNDGVRGHSGTGTGVAAFGHHAVYAVGHEHDPNSIGVYAGGIGYAGLFKGDVSVTGEFINQGGARLKIDHPLDPENQYLTHSFIESPDMMNVYNGNVVLDANGEAVVEMPTYFQALNRDFRYVLTAIGGPGPNLHIAQEIENNRFRIAGGTPALKVSWQVTGIRQDPWANQNRIVVEEPKPEDERGTYLYPEGYGQPAERGVHYEQQRRMREMQEAASAPGEAPGQ